MSVYITSRRFRLPEEPEQMAAGVWFNMWARKNWPFDALTPGDVLLWFDSPRGELVWRSVVTEVKRFRYDTKEEVRRQLEARFGAVDFAIPYFVEAPEAGYCVGWKVAHCVRTVLPRPAAYRFPMLGWERVTPDIAGLWGLPEEVTRADAYESEAVEEVVRPLRRRRTRGPGRGLTAAERRAVELRAMQLAREHFEREFPVVEDVSGEESYDLRCTGAGPELHVEVKGTTGAGLSVLLTRNEVAHAREWRPHMALVVVTGIDLDRSDPDAPAASGGVLRVLRPWDVDYFPLEGLVFQCDLSGRSDKQS